MPTRTTTPRPHHHQAPLFHNASVPALRLPGYRSDPVRIKNKLCPPPKRASITVPCPHHSADVPSRQAAAAAPAGDAPPPSITAVPTKTPAAAHCPTVTRTGTICSTCVMPECILLSTVSNPCGCPSAVATTTVDYPCGTAGGCHVGCGTAYAFAPSPTTCRPSRAPPKETG